MKKGRTDWPSLVLLQAKLFFQRYHLGPVYDAQCDFAFLAQPANTSLDEFFFFRQFFNQFYNRGSAVLG
jgi:hypothetical protein